MIRRKMRIFVSLIKKKMDKIGIFCSASDRIEPIYFEKARELGTWMGEHRKTLIYGGSNAGLMECVAKAAREAGSTIMGVVPTMLEERNAVSDLLDVTFRTDNLSERKDVMVREADILVALPGGVGTLDEIFHVMAAATIGYHSKKVVLYNVDGFWDGMLRFLEELEVKHFTRNPLSNYYRVANCLEELIEQLK